MKIIIRCRAVSGNSTGKLPVYLACMALCASVLPGQAMGQAAAWSTIEAAARQEGRVFMYGAAPVPVLTRLKAGFEKAYPGIVLEFHRANSGELIVKADQDRATGVDGGDIMVTTEIGWGAARVKDGSVKAHLGPNARAWPPRYLIDGVIPTLAMEPITIAYNTKVVKNPPTGYPDLLKPEYRGKIGVLDIAAATTVVAFYDWMTRAYGADYLPKLAANKAIFYGSAPTAAQSVAAGELEIASFVNTSSGFPLIQKGAPMKLVIPNPAFGFRYIGMVLGWAKRPNAAQVFMNYVTSIPGQTAWSGGGDSASPLPNIPGSLDASTIEPYDASPYTPAISKVKIEAWNKLFR